MDTGVNKIRDDKYASGSAGWLQVSRAETAKCIHHIDVYTYIYICVYVCVFVYEILYV
jgi:hypothetical protein